MFAAQTAHLQGRYRVIAYDHRGQGRSADDAATSISMETVYADAVALIEALKLGAVHFAGLSMGGFVAMRPCARRSEEQTSEPQSLMRISSTAYCLNINNHHYSYSKATLSHSYTFINNTHTHPTNTTT